MKPKEGKEIKNDPVVDKAVEKGVGILAEPVKEAIKKIEDRLNSPVDETVDGIGQLTTAQQLLRISKKYGKETAYLTLKKAENLGIAALNLLPVLGTVSSDLIDAAILEGATVAQATALAKGAQVVSAGEVAYPLTHIIGEKAAAQTATVLKALNPFEDVHPAIVAACGAVGIAVPGVGAVPAGIELAILEYRDIKNTASAIGEMGSIIARSPELQSVKNFTKSVVDSVTNRIQQAKSPQMVQARAAFGV